MVIRHTEPNNRSRTSPEALKFHKFTVWSDVWAMGIVLFEIMTRGEVPYAENSNKEVFQMVLRDGCTLSRPDKCPKKLFSLMKR
jgi:serine/threonine protein kinase